MGVGPSNLSPQSQPGSTLQTCLNAAFPDSSAVTYPQAISYMSAVDTYNLAYPVYPAAVVRPSTTDEVSAAVKCAVQAGVKVQARSGGHSFANYCIGGVDGALVVDLQKFQQFEMDESTWRATIGGGTLLADVTSRLHNAGGRAIAHGTCPQVGIGGHATIGGLGPTSRMWGSTLDHIYEVEVVLANGTIARANANTQQDLFFAIRGAASSYGIVTEFIFNTHPEPGSTVQYSYTLTFGSHRDMIAPWTKWQTMISDPKLDRKLATSVIIHELGMIITGTYFGTRAEYDALGFEAALSQHATVAVVVIDDWLGSVANWAESVALQLVGGIPAPFYSKSLTFTPDNLIPVAGIQSLFEYLDDANKGTLLWFVITDLEGGATNDVPADASAYGHRDTLFYIQTYAIGVGSLSQTTKDFLNGINNVIINAMPGVNFGAYAGYVDPELSNGPEQYYGNNLPKLKQLKGVLDPQNVFSNPQSVQA